jgi:uncharacterized protein YjbI with pentapeptide repeats/uncharacterized protein
MHDFFMSAIFLCALVAADEAHAQDNKIPSAAAASCQISAGDVYDEKERTAAIDGKILTSPKLLVSKIAQQNMDGRKVAVEVAGGDFTGWDFSGITLNNVCFNNSAMKNTTWDDATLNGVGFIKVDLEGASFKAAKLPYILLRETILKDADMSGAVLTAGKLDGGWGGSLEKWNLTSADMRHFRFVCSITISDGCPIDRDGIKLDNANLTGAEIDGYYFTEASTKNTVLGDTVVSLWQLPMLSSAVVKGSVRVRGGDELARITPAEVATLNAAFKAGEAQETKASFDCAKAATAAEKLICESYQTELRNMDRYLASVYKRALARDPAIANTQKLWIKRRDMCGGKDAGTCIMDEYIRRIAQLELVAGTADPLGIGETALYISQRINFPPEFSKTALFRRLTPVIIGDSNAQITLTRNKNGSYSLSGEAIGANAHVCDAGGDNLRLDRTSGWFSGRPDDGSAVKADSKYLRLPPLNSQDSARPNPKNIVAPNQPERRPLVPAFRIQGDVLYIFGDGHADYEKYPDAFASCGMRAYFSDMHRIDAPEETVRAVMDKGDR